MINYFLRVKEEYYLILLEWDLFYLIFVFFLKWENEILVFKVLRI